MKSIERLEYGIALGDFSTNEKSVVVPGAIIRHPDFGFGHVLIAVVNYRKFPGGFVDIPFEGPLSSKIRLLPNGQEIEHVDKGLAEIVGYRIAFGDKLIYQSRVDITDSFEIYD